MKSYTESIRAFLRRIALATTGVAILGFSLASIGASPASAFTGGPETAERLTREVAAHLDAARKQLETITAVKGSRTVENTLIPMQEISIQLDAAGAKSGLLESVHPLAEVREAAEKCTQDVSAFITELSLNREVFDAVSAVKTEGLDADTRRLVTETLRDYRRAGVDKDAATREKVRRLNEELVEIGQEFARNIRDGQRSIELDSAADLDGLPADYIEGHPPNAEGKIVLTTAYPDYVPFMTYSRRGDLREKFYHEYLNRGYPENREVLNRLLAKRYELAGLLGYENWAAYITEDKMARTPQVVSDFIARLDKAARPRADRDYATLLAAKRQDDPAATEVADWEKSYYSEIVKAQDYQFDSQVLRAYYNYPAVKKGILDLTSTLFGVTYQRVPDAEVWYEDVECYELIEDGKIQGRFYLDMHPREGKYSHAAQFGLQEGVKDRQLPEAVLVCNFPKPDQSGLALMEHDDVETFLHEFGHLLHTLFAGHQRWIDQSGIKTEWDFVEAPSQMLEEWAVDARTLQTFARHYETGEPIPAELIANLRRAKDFGNGLWIRQQNFYTAISLNAHNRNPETVDMDVMLPELQGRYSSFAYVPDTHMYASFGHLNGYSAMYYTYMWSLVIAKDMASRFDPENLIDPELATEYRRKVLSPGGTKDAADLVKDFLGRPYSFEAFSRWLNRES